MLYFNKHLSNMPRRSKCDGMRTNRHILGAFAVLRKTTFSLVSVRLYDRLDHLDSNWTDIFSWNFKLVAFINNCHENSSLFKIRHKYWALCMEKDLRTFYDASDKRNSKYKSERVAFPRQHLCSSLVFVFKSCDFQNPSYVTQNPGYSPGAVGSPLGGLINPDYETLCRVKIRHFIVQLMHTKYKILRLLK